VKYFYLSQDQRDCWSPLIAKLTLDVLLHNLNYPSLLVVAQCLAFVEARPLPPSPKSRKKQVISKLWHNVWHFSLHNNG